MKNWIVFLFLCFIGSVVYAQSDVYIPFKRLSVVDFSKEIQSNKVQLVDVRTATEFSNGYIEGAINLDVNNPIVFKEGIAKLSKNQAVYLYCRSGQRSQKAANILVQAGFTQVFDLIEGYLSWQNQ